MKGSFLSIKVILLTSGRNNKGTVMGSFVSYYFFSKHILSVFLVHFQWNCIGMRGSHLESILVQIMAYCVQATSHYPRQCQRRSMPPNGLTRPQCCQMSWWLFNPPPHWTFSEIWQSVGWNCPLLNVGVKLCIGLQQHQFLVYCDGQMWKIHLRS